ncbi:MAG: OsmC family protein [Inquilinus sp.]|uniref:OsmC family protein n=1 Tax=Inquilinus sp. TaxID=1932117 RepID=UPI003F378B6F
MCCARSRGRFVAAVASTAAAVTIEKDGGAFRISKSALTLTAKVDGITADEFQRIAAEAKANCPISKLFNTTITLDAKLEA